MHRLFAFFALLVASLAAAQPTPMPNVITANPVDGTFTAQDPAVPVIFFEDIGFHKQVVMDSTAMSNLATGPLEIVPAQAGKVLIPRGLLVKKVGSSTAPALDDGSALLTLASTSLTTGFLPLVSSAHNDDTYPFRAFWVESYNNTGFSTIGLLFNASGNVSTYQALPSGFQKANLFQNVPIKLTASIIATKANMTPAETWRGLVANSLSGTFRLTLIVLYQVRTL